MLELMLELVLELSLEPMLSEDVKLSKGCQMSKKQTPGLWRRFRKKLIDIMRFTHIDVNFDVTHDDHQKPSKCPQKVFMMTIIFDVKIDISICEPHCANLFFV